MNDHRLATTVPATHLQRPDLQTSDHPPPPPGRFNPRRGEIQKSAQLQRQDSLSGVHKS
ncbi:hypothetical protein ACU4GD_31170 [Cupriavidus basilensis]